MKLSDMKEKECAVVSSIDEDAENTRRLYDLGFVKGQRVRCENIALFGSPIAYSVQGAKLALRKSDAAKIGVIV